MKQFHLAAAVLLLAACQSDPATAPADQASPSVAGDTRLPGDAGSTQAYDGIKPEETLSFTGTEPFWGGEVTGAELTYKTPENPDGETIPVERFAGRGGISFSGQLGIAAFEMMVTPLECSDGMSDRTYPFTVTLEIGEEARNGCGWTGRTPFTGPANP